MSERRPGPGRAPAAALLLAGLLTAIPAPASGQSRGADGATVRDGIAAVVNDEIVSIGEVYRTALLRRDAATAGLASACGQAPAPGVSQTAVPPRPPDDAGAPERAELEAALDCLIDATLVYREVRRFPQLGVTEAQIDTLMAQMEATRESPAALDAALRSMGLLRSEVRADLRRQLLTDAYIDSRFRAIVDISEQEARRAWLEELVPDMRERGIEVPPFEQVAAELVMPLLREREVNRRVQSWIGDLRTRATIDRRFP